MHTTSSSNLTLYENYLIRSRIDMQDEDANLYVAKAMKFIIENVFAQLSVTLVITISSSTYNTSMWFENMLQNLVGSWRGATVQLQRFQLDHLERVPGRKYCNFLLVDSYEGLRATNIAADNAIYDDHEYYFIFLQTRDRFIPQEMQLIMDHCLANYWLNCNVMVQTAQVDIVVYSYYPFTEDHCQKAIPVQINRFDGHRMINEPMFPDKLRQLHGCPLTLLTWNVPPFVYLNFDHETNQLMASGFEIQLMEQLADWMNFSIVIKNLTLENNVSSYKLVNGSNEGPMEMIINQLTNFSVGYFRKTTRRVRLMTTPLTHYYTPLVATVNLDNYRFGSLAILTFPFDWSVWLILLWSLILHIFIYLCRWRSASHEVLEILLGGSLARLPRQWAHRAIYAHWIYASIPLRICYQSLLFHLIRLQLFGSVPSSFEQLLDDKFHALCTSMTLQTLQEMPQVAGRYESFHGMATVYDQNVLDELDHCKHDQRKGKVFAITSQEVTRFHLRDSNRLDDYVILNRYVNIQQLSIFMPKHSYFYEKINEAIRRFDANGFLAAMRRAAFDSNERKKEKDQRRRYIDNGQLMGIYKLMIAMYSLAAIILGIELLLRRLQGHNCLRNSESYPPIKNKKPTN
ncbi:uncharacterized protein Ir7f isoform X1 [Drosophila tropicalis]|uniref:uncharacterized protein Ir7f isoform X1 n=2 Tax=Drosophila tropicalis TaxID=46794 RepID=UPI0035ABF4EC